MYRWLFMVFLVSFSTVAQSNKGSLSGMVRTADGAALPWSSVVLEDTRYGVQTDENGTYSLENIPYGTYRIIVSYVGFKTIAKRITFNSEDQNLKIDFILFEKTENLEEVTVNGKTKQTALETKGFAVNAIKTEEAGLRNIQTNELLNTTVGVKIRQNGGLGSEVTYSLNGLSGNSVRIFIDGIPISTYGNSFNLNSISPSMIDQIEVYKGVVPGHLADDALGGAINIVLHNDTKTNLNASFSYGSFNTSQTNVNGLYRFEETGLTVKTSLFHNYSDNDYEVSGRSVVVSGLGGVQTPITAKRFNDAYRSTGGMAQIGFTDVSWADQFFIGVTASEDYKEVQHGAFMTITPYQDRFLESDALLAGLNYQKKNLLTEGFEVSINGLYGKRNRAVNDTLPWAYSWNGQRAIDFRGNEYQYAWESQQEGGPTLAKIERKVASVRTGVGYAFNDRHKVLANHVYSRIDRKDSDALRSVVENTFFGTRDLHKNIYSLTYEFKAFDDRLQASLFGKRYQQKTISVDPAIEVDTAGNDVVVDEVVSSNKKYDGYGFAASFAILPGITLLTSAERAIRLPNETEIFGNDGDNVVANSSIDPESSDNYNLGFRLGNFNIKKHDFTISTNVFTRNIKDRIGLPIETSLNVDDELIVYVNQGSGTSKGIDAQLNYSYNNNFRLSFNVSRFDLKIENQGIEIEVPNTPFFTMNGSLRYSIKDFVQKKSRTNVFYNIYFTDRFSFLTAQGSNTVGTEFFEVPQQLAQDFGLSYTFPNNRFVMSFDIKNVFDKPVYDNLSVQRPGRAFYLKLNYAIHKS